MATPIPSNRARLDARSVAEATGGRVVSSSTRRVACGVTTDSRAVVDGGAFVALRGERHDGHAYLGAAVAAGAALVVVERGRATGLDAGLVDIVEVDDTLRAWGAIAKAHVQAWRSANQHARAVAITGSAGKTTTKEICAALLRTSGECLTTTGNLNNRIGLPAVALQLEARHRFAVLEVGMSLPGEIGALADIVEPDVAVLTNIGLAHAGGVGGTSDDVAREKGALFAGLRASGVSVANADDPRVLAQSARAPAASRRVTFGCAEGADYRLVTREPFGLQGSRVQVRLPGDRTASWDLALPGKGAAADLVGALAAAEAAAGGGLDEERVALALRTVAPLPGRLHLRRLRGNVVVVDDAYNANPASMRIALGALAELDGARRVAVLGEMKELGPSAAHEHEALGEVVAHAGVRLLVSCGGLADLTAQAAARRGVDVVLSGDAEQAAAVAVERAGAGDVVLVKASRSVGAERVVDALVRAWGEDPR